MGDDSLSQSSIPCVCVPELGRGSFEVVAKYRSNEVVRRASGAVVETSDYDSLVFSAKLFPGECDPQLPPANGKRKSVFKRIGKIESQRSVFDRLGSNPQAPKRKSIHERLGVVQDVKNNASHPVEAEPSKRPRSMIPSRMRRETDIHISCGEVLKVQPRTIVHTRVHKGENEESVGSSDDVAPPQGEEASSFHITLCDEIPIEGEDAEEAPLELEEGVRAAIDELKEVDLGTPENPRPIFISTLLSNEDEKIYQKSQPLVMCRAVLEPQSQVLGALVFHHGSWSTPPLNPLCRDHGKCGLRHRVEVLILAMELKSLSKCDVTVIQKEVSTILTSRAKPRRVFALENPLTSINSVVMLSTAFSRRSDHLWRQQHEARGLEVSIEISPSNGNPPSMYKSRSDMDISPEERFSEEVKYIFSPFPVSRSVNEFASKIDVVTPLDLIINYAIPQRGKDVRGSAVLSSSFTVATQFQRQKAKSFDNFNEEPADSGGRRGRVSSNVHGEGTKLGDELQRQSTKHWAVSGENNDATTPTRG
nr:uncharacterized protein LOC109175453 [Ipomoea trifida]